MNENITVCISQLRYSELIEKEKVLSEILKDEKTIKFVFWYKELSKIFMEREQAIIILNANNAIQQLVTETKRAQERVIELLNSKIPFSFKKNRIVRDIKTVNKYQFLQENV